jgi:hypothetical protein
MHPARLAHLTRTVAFGLFALALIMVPFRTAEPQMEMRGVELLLLGWGSLLMWKFAWLANPLFIAALLSARKFPRSALVGSGLALLLAALEFPYVESVGFDSGRDIEASRVIGVGPGAYLWLTSLSLGLLSCALRLIAILHLRRSTNAP